MIYADFPKTIPITIPNTVKINPPIIKYWPRLAFSACLVSNSGFSFLISSNALDLNSLAVFGSVVFLTSSLFIFGFWGNIKAPFNLSSFVVSLILGISEFFSTVFWLGIAFLLGIFFALFNVVGIGLAVVVFLLLTIRLTDFYY